MKLYRGDCLIKMNKIPDESVDMVMCDPPYGTTACKWDTIIPLKPMWKQLKRIIKPNGAIVMTATQPFTTILIASNMKMFRYEIIWEKERPTNIFFMKKQIAKVHENILVFYKKQPTFNPQKTKTGYKTGHSSSDDYSKYRNNGSITHERQKYQASKDYDFTVRYPRSVLKIKRELQKNKDRHPTQKPVVLMKYLIRTYTNKGDTALDFAMGSGTTGVACKQLGRKFIGIEKDKKYFKLAKNRIRNTDIGFGL